MYKSMVNVAVCNIYRLVDYCCPNRVKEQIGTSKELLQQTKSHQIEESWARFQICCAFVEVNLRLQYWNCK